MSLSFSPIAFAKAFTTVYHNCDLTIKSHVCNSELPMQKVAIVRDKAFLLHAPTSAHPENPDRLTAINRMLDENFARGELSFIPPKAASFQDIELIHTPAYIKKIEDTAMSNFTPLDADTYASKATFDCALLAAGSLIDCTKKILMGEISSSFAFIRPPGHHAEKDRSMGYCIFNNVAIAAAYALKKLGLKRVAIVDFDVHHGNGTQNAFFETNEVLYISTHQYPHYPGTGSIKEIGRGKGEGFNINLPLPVGLKDADYTIIFAEIIAPVLIEYKPDLLLVSAGFDIYSGDPLGGMQITSEGFENMGYILKDCAAKTCNGRIIYSLEGGYSAQGLQEGTKSIIKTLLSEKAKLPEADNVSGEPAKTAIDMIKGSVSSYWNV